MFCIICGVESECRLIRAQERMVGLHEEFTYVECSNCGCLRLSDIPDDMSRYYPHQYYSMRPNRLQSPTHRFRRALSRIRDTYAISGTGLIGMLLFSLSPMTDLSSLRRCGIREDSRILDVGSGSGNFLCRLWELGYRDSLGVDPYVDEKALDLAEVHIQRTTVEELTGEWDLITFNHSLEHMSDQITTLQHVSRLLARGGVCVIRTPTVSSYAWEHYGSEWVQLDAPRHAVIHSVESMKLLALRCSLVVTDVSFDSNEFQFWGSEQYQRGIPLTAPNSYAVTPALSIFSRSDIRRFRQRSRELNQRNRGDQAVFYLARESDAVRGLEER